MPLTLYSFRKMTRVKAVVQTHQMQFVCRVLVFPELLLIHHTVTGKGGKSAACASAEVLDEGRV